MTAPVPCRWEGDCFRPLPRYAKECDARYVVGELYQLAEIEERSVKSHRAYFAGINEAWANLPERLAERIPSPEHLRKWALIKAGFADHREIVAPSRDDAVRLAAFIKPMDTFAVVTVSDCVVTVYTAKSQSLRTMGKKDFQASKQAVLDIIAGIIGVNTETLAENSGNNV